MRFNILYSAGGRIVALSPVPKRTADARGLPVLRSVVEPEDGQRTTVVDLDLSVCHSLAEVIQRFVVAADGKSIRLRDQASSVSAPSERRRKTPKRSR